MANSVGLTAATTVPSAATSRTKWPRVTSAMRSRSREMTWPLRSQPWISHANSSTTSAAAPQEDGQAVALPQAGGGRYRLVLGVGAADACGLGDRLRDLAQLGELHG